MKKEEIKVMVEEASGFVEGVVRRMPSNRSEELGYLMTMAVLFHEIAHREQKAMPTNGSNDTSAVA